MLDVVDAPEQSELNSYVNILKKIERSQLDKDMLQDFILSNIDKDAFKEIAQDNLLVDNIVKNNLTREQLEQLITKALLG